MNTTIKESAAPFIFLFKVVFFFVLAITLVISTINTYAQIDNILIATAKNSFKLDKRDISFLITMSLTIFAMRVIRSPLKEFIKNFVTNLLASLLCSLIILMAVELGTFAAAGILLLATLAMQSPLYAAVIASAFISTLQGLHQLKPTTKEDSHDKN
ncbi:hypothetical protein SOX05_08790 [Pseudomonas putida]|nr:hypothetical protein [Pseudomonas putida]MDY4319358.1 hypothetical protein [Pseudomonas putida]MDY4352743.1 hypothetical protein [Pseudomonas putida]